MTEIFKSDSSLFNFIRSGLHTAVVGDAMDQVGLMHQFLPSNIRPLRMDMVVVGRAMPVYVQDLTKETKHLATEEPFGLLFQALDDLKPDEVYLSSGGSPSYANWGELLCQRAMHLGAAGAVINAPNRDTRGVLKLGFPTFSTGHYAQDQGPRGTVTDFRIPIQIGQVKINPGDIIFGDIDGVCVIPREKEVEVLERAIEKVQGERLVEKAIRNGMSTVEAFKKFGIM